MAEQGHSPEGREDVFRPSWLVQDESEFNSLRSGKLGTTGKKIAMLHETGNLDTIGAEGLSERAVRWGEESVNEGVDEDGEEVWVKLAPFFIRMNKRIDNLNNPNLRKNRPDMSDDATSDINGEIKEILAQLTQHQKDSLEYQRLQFELMKKGYKGFIQGITKRLHVNPEQYDQQLPPWFEELDANKQRMLSNLLHVNYLAAIKEDDTMSSLESWTGALNKLNFTDEALADMIKDVSVIQLEDGRWVSEGGLPGFRVMLATMVKDIFQHNEDHFVISEKGYEIVGSERKLNLYKNEKSKELATYLNENYGKPLEYVYRVSNEELAEFVIASIDTIFFATGAYDSGDEKRAIKAGDAKIYSEALRAAFMPGIRGKKGRWLPPERDVLQGVSPRDFGGPLGRWIRENSLANRNGFQDKLRRGEIQLIPDRMFFSIFDHAKFSRDSNSEYAGKSFAEALVNSQKIEIAPGIWDFAGGQNALPILDLERELFADYSDTISAPLGLLKHLTSDKGEDVMDRTRLKNAIIKAREDTRVNSIFLNEDVVTAAVIRAIAPSGLELGITEMVLRLPEVTYDEDAYQVFGLEDEIFEGMRPDFINRLIKKLHVVDKREGANIGVLEAMKIRNQRRILRDQAVKNREK